MTTSPLLTCVQAAERLGVSDDTVRILANAGKLAHVRVGIGTRKARIRFTEADLEAYIARNRVAATTPDAEPEPAEQKPIRFGRRRKLDLPEAQRYA